MKEWKGRLFFKIYNILFFVNFCFLHLLRFLFLFLCHITFFYIHYITLFISQIGGLIMHSCAIFALSKSSEQVIVEMIVSLSGYAIVSNIDDPNQRSTELDFSSSFGMSNLDFFLNICTFQIIGKNLQLLYFYIYK